MPCLHIGGCCLSPLTAYGLLSVSLGLIFYALESKSHIFVLLFSVSCVMASVYGFLQGAWPFGLVEIIWSGVALKRWLNRSGAETKQGPVSSKVK
jgi:hypothetical protein